jgi:sarcosine oxidase, subunit alpha
MSHRLPTGGRLIDRSRRLDFTFDGKALSGVQGDTLASALMANGRVLMGRSFKYHRPRGPLSAGPEEPNALVELGTGQRFEPNQRATVTDLVAGLSARSQNRWPSLDRDAGAVLALMSRFFPAGFYYKTFMWPPAWWHRLYEPVIRRMAGLGRAPDPETRDADRYEQAYAFCDTLVVGGGIAGLAAALAASAGGARVLLLEQAAHWGGRAPVDGDRIDGLPAQDWVARALDTLRARPNVRLLDRTSGAAVHDHGYVLGWQRLTDHQPGADAPRQRLWRIRADRVIAATGAIERPLAFAGNDVPGVMLAGAMRDLAVNWAVAAGRHVVIATNNDDAYRTALVLHQAGVTIKAVIDARPRAAGVLPDRVRALGIRVAEGTAIRRVTGGKRVEAIELCPQDGDGASTSETIICDALGMSGGWSPAVHLWSQPGGRLIWDESGAMFRPDPAHPPITHDGRAMMACVGAANGRLTAAAALADAWAAGGGDGPAPQADTPPEAPLAPVWLMPARAGYKLRSRAFLDPQNDVKVTDVQLAAQEGFRSVEHAKRYTTLGMATDQGKTSNIPGLAILSDALGQPIPATGTTTFRPPWTPVTMGALAGEAQGALFQPLRKTPLHAWHEAAGAVWEPVGLWRRPFAYVRKGETRAQAVAREVRAVRTAVGLLDASTLGKILVKGPDAHRLVDMLYTNVMSGLPVGRCRYGLMCNENGFVMDDGVAARLTDDAWLLHTTSGGADRIHAWIEDWLQTEWWDWQVHAINLTEQFAQIAVAGPQARALLERLGGIDLSRERLPFMHWAEGTLAGLPARVFRISFSGELGFEVAVPAGRGPELWDRLHAAGADLGATPYGTEALHILRAEKGYVMIGDETDGTVTPHDLNLGGLVSRKKADFLGKRGLERPLFHAPDRWRLVGLEAVDGSVLPHGALAPLPGVNANGQRLTQGRVTSTYPSPTLGRGVALGLVARGPERLGEVIDFAGDGGRMIPVRLVPPCAWDPEGERLNA